MSITNIISNEEITLVQGVDGLFLCEEAWMKHNRKNFCCEKFLDKEITGLKNESLNRECPQIGVLNFLKLTDV